WDTTGLAGSYALRAVLADGAGNTTASTITIRVDNAAPTGTVAIDAGAAVARNPAVTLALSAVDPAPGSGVRQMRFTNGGATTWSAWEPVATTKAWSLAAGDGAKTVAVQVKDAAGNVATFRDGIRLDTVKPSGTVTIDQGATTTASRAVTLTLTATDPTPGSGVAAMRIRNAGGTWSAWQPVATSAPWTLTAGAGGKRVDVQVRDKAGNVSAVASDSITFEP
ncbi:MAG: hypothetical protein AVDCRST_MAG73-2200, partial [uncultured Thermomicrobiales bacterium]